MALALDLQGRRALVTGAGRGVGRGIAHQLAAAGAEVVVNDLAEDRAGAVAEEIAADGGGAAVSAFDVTDYGAVTAAVERVGGVDILVNNAGNAGALGVVGVRRPFAETEPDDWAPYVGVNLYGVMHCARAVLPGMIDRGWGRIISIVSDSGRTGDKYMAAYSAAKAGAAGFTRALALEAGRHGVTVNCVALGTMRTEATDELWAEPDDPTAEALLQRYVVRRPGTPEDAGAVVVLLASDEASWITGQTYPVNGGFSFAM